MKTGIIGCGLIAEEHRQAYAAYPEADVAACFDVNREAAQNVAAKCSAQTADSIEEIIEKFDLDAVSVCTPPAFHLKTCEPFLRAGIAVLCEKPIAANTEDAEKLAQIADETGTPFMVAFCHRFHPAIIRLKEIIDSGQLGRPLFLNNIFGGYLDITGNHRSNGTWSGGGVLIDNCNHSFDLVRFLLGEPEAVSAETGNVVQHVEVEDFCQINLRCSGGTHAQIASSYSLPGCSNRLEWHGTEGTATVNYWNPGQPDLVIRSKKKPSPNAIDCSDLPDRFTTEVKFFLDCIRRNEKPTPSAQDGLKISRIVQAAYRSAREQKTILIDE